MDAFVHATLVTLRHLEDEVSLARTKSSNQALDTIAQVATNICSARERLQEVALAHATPARRDQLARAISHIDEVLHAARQALESPSEEQLRGSLNDIVEHLLIATACADE